MREYIGLVPVQLADGIAQGEGEPIRVVWVRPARTREMLWAGCAPLCIEAVTPEEQEAQAEAWLQNARALAVACVRKPFPVVFEPRPGEKAILVDAITDADLACIYSRIVHISHTLFFGTDRTARLPDEVIERQHDLAVMLDLIMERYGAYKLSDLLTMTDAEMSELWAVFQAGTEARKTALEKSRE